MSKRDRTIVFFRVNKVQPPVVIGDVCDIVDGKKSIGKAIDFAGGDFTQVRVTDLSEELEEELIIGIKRVRVPTEDDPLYNGLVSGKITVTEAQLLNYVEVV